MSLPPASPVSLGRRPAEGAGTTTNGTCGRQPTASSKPSGQLSFFSKTSQGSCQAEGLSLSGETYAAWVTAWKQESLARQRLALRTSASASLCSPTTEAPSKATRAGRMMWPTPTTPSGGASVVADAQWTGPTTAYTADGTKLHVTLSKAVQRWPTPRATDSAHAAATAWELARHPNKDLLHARVARAEMWPTPNTGAGGQNAPEGSRWVGRTTAYTPAGRKTAAGLPAAVKHGSILTATAVTEGNPSPTGRRLSAAWVTLLMGLPAGWTCIPGERGGRPARHAWHETSLTVHPSSGL